MVEDTTTMNIINTLLVKWNLVVPVGYEREFYSSGIDTVKGCPMLGKPQRLFRDVNPNEIFRQFKKATLTDGSRTVTVQGYHAPLQVRVTVADGKLKAVEVTEHAEEQFNQSLVETPRRILEAGSVFGLDAVTGATYTSEAILRGTGKAALGG